MDYSPETFRPLTFHDALQRFREGSDTPRAYLERCLATIAEREPEVMAFAHLNENGARAAADASSARWKAGAPLSVIDGLPIGIKDLLETADMPTEMGSAFYKGNRPGRDSALVQALRAAGAVIVGLRLVLRHILPNAMGPVIVAATIDIAAAIIAESTLSFLGLGFPPDVPTWGRLLFDAKDNLDFAPHWAIFPGAMIFLTVLAINFIGDGLRDAFDPRRVIAS
jgi:hypothetical protein